MTFITPRSFSVDPRGVNFETGGHDRLTVDFEGVARPPVATSLDTREQGDRDPLGLALSYSEKQAEWLSSPFRLDTIAALAGSGDTLLVKQAQKMRECSTSTIILSGATRARMTPNHCTIRACQVCTYHRTRKARRKFSEVSKGKRLRFLTLTQVALKGESFAAARGRLLGSYTKLGRREEYKHYVAGALRVCESTWNEERGSWNLHFHLIFEGRYWPQDELQELWQSCGGGIVDVRAATSVDELLKYALKTANVPKERIVEWAQAMHGKRDIEYLGAWRGLVVSDCNANGAATDDELAAFRYACEDDELVDGDICPISEARLTWVALSDPYAAPETALWALHRLRDCFADLAALTERVEKRLEKRRTYL